MLLHADSFGIYGTTDSFMSEGVYDSKTAITLTATNPRTGTYAASWGTSGYLRWALPSTKTEVGVAYAIRPSALPSDDISLGLMSFLNASAVAQLSVWVTSTGAIEVRSGSHTGTVLGRSGDNVVTAAAYTFIEVWVGCDATTGYVHIGLGDSSLPTYSLLHLTDVDTDPSGTGEYSYVGIANRRTANAAVFLIDDLTIYDSTGSYNNAPLIGDSAVEVLSAAADTASTDWAKSTGVDGYNLINDSPPDDTRYVSTSTILATSRFTLSNLSGTYYRVRGIVVYSRQKKTASGTVSTQVSMYNSGSTSNGTARDLTTSFAYYRDVFETDPVTSGPWTTTTVDASNIQIKKVS